MKYIFKISICTDGDFGFSYVPRGMTFDGDERYEFKKSYDDRNIAIEDVFNICRFLKEQMNTSRKHIKEYWDESINEFVKELKFSENTEYEEVRKYMYGNYDGTEFSFYTENEYVNCGFYATDEEIELIKNNHDGITNEMIKEVVLDLFRNNRR